MVTNEAQQILDDTFFFSGEIAYEHDIPVQVRHVSGATRWEPDPLVADERFVAASVRGKGIVVFTACSRAGVVNVLKHARNCFPDQPLYAVMGGFHLSGENEPIIPDTIRDLADFDLRVIVPAHCTGCRAVNALTNRFGDVVVAPAAVGKSFGF